MTSGIPLKGCSLLLISNGRAVFTSDKSGIRPLVECVIKFNNIDKKCVLMDKVVGLAAARIIVYAGFIDFVITPLASKKAIDLLEKHKINIAYDEFVDCILNKNKDSTCPMEQKAEKYKDNSVFFNHVKALLGY